MSPKPPPRAEELKTEGNKHFTAQNYSRAEDLYTQALLLAPYIPAYYTNRALARLRQDKHALVVDDALAALRLSPDNVKAHTYLAQARLALGEFDGALAAGKEAYRLAVEQRSPSVGAIANTLLGVRKRRWEAREERRLRVEAGLWSEVEGLMLDDARRRGEEREKVLEKVEALRGVFERADPTRFKRREVPEWAIDAVTFSIMVDPVVTKLGHSYERATILEHLRRTPTDPLTRQPLSEADLRPNLALRQACEEFVKENGWALDW